MKKIFVIAVMLLALCSCRRELVILHVNDTHSHFEPVRSGEYAGLGGVIERAAFVDSVRNAAGEDNVLLLHAGDFGQGTSYFSELGGDLEIETINAFEYDVVTLGNHEFDNGIEELTRRLENLDDDVQVVCANYDFSPFGLREYVKPYAVVERAGLKIGVIGMLTDIAKVVDRNIADRIPKYDNVETVNKWSDYLKNTEKCDLVVMLSHLGFREDLEIVPQTRNIDLVVGGHSHTFLDEPGQAVDLDGKTVMVVQAGCWGEEMGVVRY